MNRTELILIRHSETIWNAEGRVQGHLDSPLTPLGHQQAIAIATRVAAIPIHALYSSDLGRALETARYVEAATGIQAVTEPGLRERHNGVIEGMTIAEAQTAHPAVCERLGRRDVDYCAPAGGESIRAASDRACRTMSELAERHAGERIAVVSHGAILSAFVRRALGLPLEAYSRFTLRNASISWVTYAGVPDGWTILSLGEVSHLEGLPQTYFPSGQLRVV